MVLHRAQKRWRPRKNLHRAVAEVGMVPGIGTIENNLIYQPPLVAFDSVNKSNIESVPVPSITKNVQYGLFYLM